MEGRKYSHKVGALRMLAEKILRPVLIKRPDISTMEELGTVLEELSTQSK